MWKLKVATLSLNINISWRQDTYSKIEGSDPGAVHQQEENGKENI
jgi:hypothetical protein